MTTQYWNVSLGDRVEDRDFFLTANLPYDKMPRLPDDSVLFLLEKERPVAAARTVRCRIGLERTEILLDRRLEINDSFADTWSRANTDLPADADIFPASPPENPSTLDKRFEEAKASPFPGKSPLEVRRHIRSLVVAAFEDDLLGPARGPDEKVVDTDVRDRYILGRLQPAGTFVPPEEEDDAMAEVGGDDRAEGSGASGEKKAARLSLQPSSIGLSFTVGSETDAVLATVGWGRYAKDNDAWIDLKWEMEEQKSEASSGKSGRKVKVWRRTPHERTLKIALSPGKFEREIDPNDPGVRLEIVVRPAGNAKLVSLFLVNRTEHDGRKTASDDKWVFQPCIRVKGMNDEPVFLGRDAFKDVRNDDLELQKLDMLYRNAVEFGTGHGVSVHARPSADDPSRGVSIETRVIPKFEVAATETPGTNDDDREAMKRLVGSHALDMAKLAELSVPEKRGQLVKTLRILADDYAKWIDELEQKKGLDPRFETPAESVIAECREALRRLREGIGTLGKNDDALKAFGFANRAMALQRAHSIFLANHPKGPDGGVDFHEEIEKTLAKSESHTWRPFQLAFFLLLLPGLADPMHPDRTGEDDATGDLLWFPTGGGKTEAYLGAAAFAMAVRRLRPNLAGRDGSRGLAVVMRYTLRLLTLQQFQRASTLVCAMELIRREDEESWGKTPFSIGLWVGSKVTPNNTKDASNLAQKARNGKSPSEDAPFQVHRCPWCGASLRLGRDADVSVDELKTRIFCPNLYCDFYKPLKKASKRDGLPLKVIDEEIYRRPPSMLIATVDKFAQMALNGNVRTLFGFAEKECPRHGLVLPGCDCRKYHNAAGGLPRVDIVSIDPIRPPDLIIQDEFHLIGGPLGTMVALYETAVDDLCSWEFRDAGRSVVVRPKIVASTATVRKAQTQMQNVFLRRMKMFPPSGLDADDNFFSVARPTGEKPGRLYVGLCSPGSARPPVMIRLYSTLLTAAQNVFERFGEAADSFMTLVGYFNSLKELGGMRRLVEDDVWTRVRNVRSGEKASGLTYRPGMSARRCTRSPLELTSRVASTNIPGVLEKIGLPHEEKNESPDVVLATNMISVGVDVPRLGLMAVNGQPKNTAEYIQATSRVGRSTPGLVCTAFAWSRPRDLSHYESFENYHAAFYKHVEAQSVTPFSSRALDRGLVGALVSDVRLRSEGMAPGTGARRIGDHRDELDRVEEHFKNRAWKATDSIKKRDDVHARIENVWSRWRELAGRTEAALTYTSNPKEKTPNALISSSQHSKGPWFVPPSMREVEPDVDLICDSSKSGIHASLANGASEQSVVGDVRPSQVMWSYGPGSMIDLLNVSVIALGLDAWEKMPGWPERARDIQEPRLLRIVQSQKGLDGVEKLLLPPVAPDGRTWSGPKHELMGMPVSLFPRWYRCPKCNALGNLDEGSAFESKSGRSGEIKVFHKSCSKPAVPARFLVACSHGHIDDFPWRAFVHGGPTNCRELLRFYEVGSSLQTANLFVACGCGKKKTMSEAFGKDVFKKMKIPCRGRHPHFGAEAAGESCDGELRTILLGASNGWFPKVLSVLALPRSDESPRQKLYSLIGEHKRDLDDEGIESVKDMAKTVAKKRFNDLSPDRLGLPIEGIYKAWRECKDNPDVFKAHHDELSNARPSSIKIPEWNALTNLEPSTVEEDFEAERGEVPALFTAYLQNVVLLKRLREVRALVGFTRLEAEDPTADESDRPQVVALSKGETEWVPAVEVRGEGLFFQFSESALAEWEKRPAVLEREEKLRSAHAAWRQARQKNPDEGFPGIRFALLHTFAHVMIRELALACGYGEASIRERVYASAGDEQAMAGVLLYTASSDSDGTLGGLVDLGKRENLGPLMEEALRRARVCSSDPFCSSYDPKASSEQNTLDLHLAACHACSYVSETSCENGNRYLDRALLVETLAGPNCAFFRLDEYES